MKHTIVTAGDGYALSAHVFGDARAARAGVPIVPAMGVEQQYYTAFAHWRALQLPLLSLSFTDDEYLSERNIESLHAFHAAAAREMRRFSPEDIGVPGIGHFGFFRRRFEASLWPRAGEWLDQQVRSVH